MIHKTLRTPLCLALAAALYVPAVFARQTPATARAEQPDEPRTADIAGEFSRLFPDRTSCYVEIPHVASLVGALGGAESLLETVNSALAGPAKDAPGKDPKDAARPAPALSAKELGALLDTSAAIAFIPSKDAHDADAGPMMMMTDPRAAVVVLHMNGADGVEILRDRVFARFGAPLGAAAVHGVEVTRMAGFSYAVSGRAVLVGRDDNVAAVLETASGDGHRLGDEPGFVSAISKHTTGQDQIFSYVSGPAIATTLGMFFGVRPPRGDGRSGKEAPAEVAMRAFVGLEAIQGLAVGVRFDVDGLKVRYDFEIDRSRTGLVSTLADPPALTFRAASLLPADTERLTALSVDAMRIYDMMAQAFEPLPPASPNAGSFSSEVAEIEQAIGVSLRGELLPALGNEVTFTGTMESGLFGMGAMPDGKQRPLSVLVLEVRNPDVIRKVIGKLVTLGPLAPDQAAVTPVVYKGAELWAMPGGGPSILLGKDFAMLGEADDLRRCLDAQEAGTVLAKAPEYAANSSAWAGDALFATYETAAFREATEQAMAKQREALRKQAGGNDQAFLESMTMMSALPSALPSTVFRDGTGLHWENSAPTGPLAGLCAYVLKQIVRQNAPHDDTPPSDNEVVGLVRTLASAEAIFRSREERYGTLDELSSSDYMSARELRSILKRTNYRVEVTPTGTGDGSRFEVVATPVVYGKPGKLSFFVDDSYIIRAADKQGAPATVSDTPYTYGGEDDSDDGQTVRPAEMDDENLPVPATVDVEPPPDSKPNE